MQQREDLVWVEYVLRDVVTFLGKNDMMESAEMLAATAAHIQHHMKRVTLLPQPTVETPSNVLMFTKPKKRLT